MRLLARRDLVCQQAVELVTEYLAQMRETISLSGRLAPEDLTPQMQDEFVDLFRRWQSEQQ
jgi:hypothetical protein